MLWTKIYVGINEYSSNTSVGHNRPNLMMSACPSYETARAISALPDYCMEEESRCFCCFLFVCLFSSNDIFPNITVGLPLNTLGAYLKKSFLQYSFPSREKHFSVKVHLQSLHWTHLMCHGLSKTFSRNLSRIGFSQLAQWSIVSGDIPQPRVRDKGWTLALQRPRHLGAYLLECDPGNPTHPNEFRTGASTS